MTREAALLKADLHIHTCYSPDSDIPLDKLASRCQELGLGAIAVSDHDTVDGALKLRDMAPFPVIVAEEILTPEGEIMGLFLKETIPGGLPVDEAIERIRAQGGLVCIPHPFDRFRSSAVQFATLERIAGDIDIIEAFNARTIPLQDFSRPRRFAQEHHLLMSAGSDSHSLAEVGRGYVEMPSFDTPEGFLKALAQASVHGQRSSIFIHAVSMINRLKKRLKS